MSNKIPSTADVARAADKLRKHCTIHNVLLTGADYWEVEYTEVIETESETRGADGPYMRERTERRDSVDDGTELEELVDLLLLIREDDNLEHLTLYLPAYLVDALL